MNSIMTQRSDNRKTGKIPVSMTEMKSCPPNCRLRKTCYAVGHGLGFTWRRMSAGKLNTLDWDSFCQAVRDLKPTVKIWRHNQAGDLPGLNGKLDREACLKLAKANQADGRNRGGFTYTHYTPVAGHGISKSTALHNRRCIASMVKLGFAVNLSADNPAHADELADLGIAPVVTVVQKDRVKNFKTPKGRTIMLCPATLSNHETTCQKCGICRKVPRNIIIGFPAHGFNTNKMSTIAESMGPFGDKPSIQYTRV